MSTVADDYRKAAYRVILRHLREPDDFARAITIADALDREGVLARPAIGTAGTVEHAIEMTDGKVRVYVQRNVAMPHLEPERVDAIQWTGSNFAELVAAFPEVNARMVGEGAGRLVASVTGGELSFKVGWWLIRTHSGYRCAMFPWAFERRYRPYGAEEAPRG